MKITIELEIDPSEVELTTELLNTLRCATGCADASASVSFQLVSRGAVKTRRLTSPLTCLMHLRLSLCGRRALCKCRQLTSHVRVKTEGAEPVGGAAAAARAEPRRGGPGANGPPGFTGEAAKVRAACLTLHFIVCVPTISQTRCRGPGRQLTGPRRRRRRPRTRPARRHRRPHRRGRRRPPRRRRRRRRRRPRRRRRRRPRSTARSCWTRCGRCCAWWRTRTSWPRCALLCRVRARGARPRAAHRGAALGPGCRPALRAARQGRGALRCARCSTSLGRGSG